MNNELAIQALSEKMERIELLYQQSRGEKQDSNLERLIIQKLEDAHNGVNDLVDKVNEIKLQAGRQEIIITSITKDFKRISEEYKEMTKDTWAAINELKDKLAQCNESIQKNQSEMNPLIRTNQNIRTVIISTVTAAIGATIAAVAAFIYSGWGK